jgi:D-alanyl-lipoteichoic acid acyltransferase DltB (MBOAT superfamily)
MLFTSYEFLIFVLITAVLYYTVPKRFQWGLLLVANYVFYALAGLSYLPFILLTTITTYLGGMKLRSQFKVQDEYLALHKSEMSREERKEYKAKEKKKRWHMLLLVLLFNLGILAVLKYTNFTISNINSLLHTFGSDRSLGLVDFVLPMGISFYTFQSLGYIIDVYRGKYEAETNPFKFALFVSFFPQLVQGPISRFDDLSQSLFAQHRFDSKTVSYGLQRMLWGYFKKMVIADRMLVAVNTIIRGPEEYTGAYVFVGMLFYAFELYADFTGGIDITIGIAEMLGIHVTENFRRPYFSKNIKEYWNRWHITMGSWFTDYIFYPISVCQPMLNISKASRKLLGDALGKRVPVYLSSFVVWFTTGIWHGASWNFIVWGLGNFVVIMISQECEPFYRWFHKKFPSVGDIWAYRAFQVIRTILLMSSLRMFDCYRDVPLTFKMFGSIFTDSSLAQLTPAAFTGMGITGFDYAVVFVGMLILITVSLIGRSGSVRGKIATCAAPVRFIIWYGLFMVTLIFGAYGIGYSASQFIYNQF